MKQIFCFLFLCIGFVSFGQNLIADSQLNEALASVAKKYRLTNSDIAGYRISDQYVQQKNKSVHVYVNQTAHGLDVFNAQIQMHFSKKGKLVFFNSSFVSDAISKTSIAQPKLGVEAGFLTIIDTLDLSLDPGISTGFKQQEAGVYKMECDELFLNPVRVRLGYELIENKLILAYKYAFELKRDNQLLAISVDAQSGKVVRWINRTVTCSFQHNEHTNECFASYSTIETRSTDATTPKTGASYHAFPIGIESPIHGNRVILTSPENVTASPFGWHDMDGQPGAEYTITAGNNVYCYEDSSDVNDIGYSPDGGPLLNFDFPFDLTATPQMNMNASLTNLFVWNNWMHDVTYYYGFDEASGNFQMNNYGNGGAEQDAVVAEGLDGGGFNNANFGTPEDGLNPRMQMYLWVHNSGELLTVNSPASIAGTYATGASSFGLGGNFQAVTADVVLINSGGANPTQGCDFALNAAALAGKIALIDRGTCPFIDKVMFAQDAGAVGVIIANNVAGGPMSMGGTDNGQVAIPVISVSITDGNLLKTAVANGPLNATLGGDASSAVLDGSFDNGVIAHEYGHGISNRLTGGPSQVDCLFNQEQAGEGWSDFFSLIMTTPTNSDAAQVRAIGNFANNSGLNGGGIRPYPYSRDLSINPLTYGNLNSLSIPHGIGSMFCTVLWDLYWNMVDEYGNSGDLLQTSGGNNKTIQLVMEGLRLQACNPGFVDSRDAILAADELLFDGENACIIWQTFARRGLGYSASQGSSDVVGDEEEAFDLPSSCFASGLTEISSEDFTIYPNPTENLLFISNAKGIEVDQVAIYDLSGKEIVVFSFSSSSCKMDVSLLQAGMYMLEIHSDVGTTQKRIVKQ